MRPPRPQRKVDNWCPIPSSKSATKPTRESSIRLADFSKNSLPARARKELVCNECHAFPRKLFAFDAVSLGSRDVPFATGSAERVAEPVFKQAAGRGNDRMGPPSAKFDPEMESED